MTEQTAPKSTTDLTLLEFVDTLTGEEEDRIEAQYGRQIYDLIDGTSVPTRATRALVFTDLVREGVKVETADKGKVITDAKKRSHAMTIREISDYFSGADDDSDDARELGYEPTTAVGKDATDAV